MIIFYDKKTGRITGTIDGRIHSPEHLKIWIGDKKKTDRIIVNWNPVKTYKDKKGNVTAVDYAPEHEQKELFMRLDKNPIDIYQYKVDLKTKKLVSKAV